MSDPRALGSELRRLREAAGLTTLQLSERSRVREAYLVGIEQNREEPSSGALRRIADTLDPSGAAFRQLAQLLTAPELNPAGDVVRAGRESAAGVAPIPAAPSQSLPASITELQFDRAEFDDRQQRTPCVVCQQSLTGSYFEVNGQTVCRPCCDQLRAGLNAGSPWSRAWRATAAGAAAAVVGMVVYFGIIAMTGYAFGLIAALIGVVVGKAVNWGSYGRGGWKYQALAVALTYMSIATSYLPLVLERFVKPDTAATAAQATNSASTAPPAGAREVVRPPAWFLITFGVAVLFVLTLIAPFAGFDAIRLVIIGIGVYEAWKLNRRRPVVMTGPHALAPEAAPAVAT